jgi:hypothetical protein
MHCVSPARRRCNSAIRSSIRCVQLADSFAQSARSGTRVVRKFREFDRDLLEREANLLREDDERNPPKDRAQEAAMP